MRQIKNPIKEKNETVRFIFIFKIVLVAFQIYIFLQIIYILNCDGALKCFNKCDYIGDKCMYFIVGIVVTKCVFQVSKCLTTHIIVFGFLLEQNEQ